jgi:flagellar hook-basal body complex protein FliE
MDPISAFRYLSSPDLVSNQLQSGAAQGAKGISASEMSGLSSTSGLAGLESFRADRAGLTRAPGANLGLEDLAASSPATSLAAASGAEPAGSFSNVLSQMVGEVNDKQNAASSQVQGLLSGQNVSVHQAMISMEEAHLSFQLMVQVRNKLLDSYQELMRMQI